MVASKLSVSKVSGAPDESGWSQVYEFDDIRKDIIFGPSLKLVVLVSDNNITHQNQIDAVRTGRDVAIKLKSLFEKMTDLSSFESLKKSTTEAYNELPAEFKALEIVAVAVDNDALFVSMIGGGVVYSYHNNKLYRVIYQERGSGNEISLSGKVDKNIVFVGTSTFAERFGTQKMENILAENGDNSQEMIDQILSEVRGGESYSRVALSVFQNDETKSVELFEEIKKIEDRSETESRITDSYADQPSVKKTPFSLNKALFIKREEDQNYLLPKQKTRKAPLFVGLLFLLALTGSIVYGINKKKDSDFKERYSGVLTEALHNVAEATEIYKLDRQKSRQLFSDSLDKLNDLKAQNVPSEDLQPLSSAIQQGRNQILGEYASSSELFLDTTLLSQDFSAKKIEIDEGQLYVSDLLGKIVKVDMETKRSGVVLGSGQLSGIVDFDVYQGRTYVLTDDGVYEIFDEKVSKRTEEGDSLFRISVYDGNLYVADMASNRIWKYVNGDNGFSAPIEWTSQTENEFRNFSDLVDWEIDGSVWVLRENAEVLRLVQGKVNEFGFKDVVPELSEAKSIFADKNLDELFILDSKEKRLVIIDKENGEYIAQYSLDGINNPQGVVVNKDQKKAFILSDGKLYSIDLLHSE